MCHSVVGEEMDFIELLKSFGLDMSSVATALGLDLDTLNAMGNDKLLQILQHSRKWRVECRSRLGPSSYFFFYFISLPWTTSA